MVEGYEVTGMGGIANVIEAYLLSQENQPERTDDNIKYLETKLERLGHMLTNLFNEGQRITGTTKEG